MNERPQSVEIGRTAFAEPFSFVVKMNVYFGFLFFGFFSIIKPLMKRHTEDLPLPSHYSWIVVGAIGMFIILALMAKFDRDVRRHFSQEHLRTRTRGREGPTLGASMYQMILGAQIGVAWAGTPSLSVAFGFTAVFLAVLAYYPLGRKRELKQPFVVNH